MATSNMIAVFALLVVAGGVANAQEGAKAYLDFEEQQVTLTQVFTPASLRHTIASLTSNEARLAFADRQVTPDDDVNSDLIHRVKFAGLGTKAAHELHLEALIAKQLKPGSLRKLVNKANCLLCASKTSGDHGEEPLKIEDPCAPKGFVSQVQHKSIASLEFLADAHDESSAESQVAFVVKGTGSFSGCKRSLEELFAMVKKERVGCQKAVRLQPSCAADLLGEPFVLYESRSIIGKGELHSITRFFSLSDYNRKLVIEKAEEMCKIPHEQLSQRYQDTSKAENLCFDALWVETFLTRGLNMPASQESFRVSV